MPASTGAPDALSSHRFTIRKAPEGAAVRLAIACLERFARVRCLVLPDGKLSSARCSLHATWALKACTPYIEDPMPDSVREKAGRLHKAASTALRQVRGQTLLPPKGRNLSLGRRVFCA